MTGHDLLTAARPARTVLDVPDDGDASPSKSKLPAGTLDRAAVAELFGITQQSVANNVHLGRIPQPDYRIGRTPLWNEQTIQQALADRRPPGRPRLRPDQPSPPD